MISEHFCKKITISYSNSHGDDPETKNIDPRAEHLFKTTKKARGVLLSGLAPP